jgi:hypothetical protein
LCIETPKRVSSGFGRSSIFRRTAVRRATRPNRCAGRQFGQARIIRDVAPCEMVGQLVDFYASRTCFDVNILVEQLDTEATTAVRLLAHGMSTPSLLLLSWQHPAPRLASCPSFGVSVMMEGSKECGSRAVPRRVESIYAGYL